MAKLELSRRLSMTPDHAWQHASDFSTLGDWLKMHQGWRCELPDELAVGTTLVGVAGVKGMRNRVTWTVRKLDAPSLLAVTGEGVGGTKYGLKMTVKPNDSGCDFTVKIDLGGRPLFGPIGATAARLVKGDIERSIERFEELYSLKRHTGWREIPILRRRRFAKLVDMSVKPIPEGYTSLTPFLCIDGASAAIDFYVSVFGAKLVDRMDGPGDTVAHAELDFGNGRLQLSDPQEAYQIAAADPTASATHSVALYCEDVDDVVARAEKAGATIREPAQTFVTGDRFASVLDPFGQRWTVMTRIADVSPEERERRMAEWAKENV